MSKKAIIIGATSGIGQEVAILLHDNGWTVGVAGRREDRLEQLSSRLGEKSYFQRIDIDAEDCISSLDKLIGKTGGMDLYFHSSGIGFYNPQLDESRESSTIVTNCVGFTRMVSHAYRYFREKGTGHIAIISSVAATRPLGAAPAYSASKRYQRSYIEALRQLAAMDNLDISLTEIRPGFVRTDLLNGDKYPLMLEPKNVAEHIVNGISKRRRLIVIDWKYRLITALWKLVPQYIWEKMTFARR